MLFYSAAIWCSDGWDVSVKDAVNMLEEGDISDNVITLFHNSLFWNC